jgi:Carboxypeptidase regulatory-like domain/TonB-dependent Receptor Plug Domain
MAPLLFIRYIQISEATMLSALKRVSVFHLMVLFLLPICLAPSLRGQATTGTIEGTVTDIQGAAIPNVTVTVTNTGTGISRKITTDEAGRYLASSLIPGVYEVDVEANGFKTSQLKGITLNISQVLGENVTLQVGGATETVSVEAGASTVATETSTSSNGQVIDNKQVVELPLANRQFYNLTEIAPGVLPPAQNSTLGFRGGFNVNGAPETDNQFLVNGTFNNDMGTNQPSFRPSVETIGEFKVLTGVYSADYGRFAGGQIVMITKQGTNRFHGSAYEFIRNGAIEAKPWSASPQTLNPAFKQNTFGATVGGPVLRDKAFFFFGYEGQRIRQQLVLSSTVPTPWAIKGCIPNTGAAYNPFTGAALTAYTATNPATSGACLGVPGGGYDITNITDAAGVNLFNTSAAKLSQQMESLAYPLPNVTTVASATSNVAPSNNYLFSETRRESSNAYNVRGDYKLSDKDSFSGTWNYFNDPSYEPYNSLCSSRTLPNFGCFTNQLSTLANVGETHMFSANLLNEVRFGFSRLVQPRIQEDNTTIGSKWPGIPGQLPQTAVPNNYGLPSIAVTNYTATGGQTNLPQNRWTNHFQFTDFVTWTHGPHSFKFGFDMTNVKSTEYEVTTGRGNIGFANATLNTTNGSNHYGTTNYALGDMLLGIPATTSITPTAPLTYNRFSSYDLFVMDDWKATPYLTVNLGMRYEINMPVSEKYGQIASFSPTLFNPTSGTNGAFIIASQAGQKSLYQTDHNNFAPRVGFAWQPFKNDKTVVKSAYGVFYQEPILYNEFLNYSLQYPIRYPKSFTSAAVNTTAKTIAGSPNTLLLDNAFNPADIPTPGQTYCVAGSSGCTTTACATSTTGCGLTPVITGTTIDPHYATPYWHEWTLGIQRQITTWALGEVTYYGSKGNRIAANSVSNYNATGPSALKTANTQALRVYPNWGNISLHTTNINSTYESLSGRLQISTKSGISVLTSYTFGKSLDGLTSAQNPIPGTVFNGVVGKSNGDKGLSAFNVKHRLVVSPVIALPFGKGQKWATSGVSSAIFGGWQLSGIFQYQTGRPFATTDTSVSSGSYGGGDRPNFIADINASKDSVTGAPTHTAAEWFNIHAIGTRAAGTFGNSAPNAAIGPGLVQVDATVARTFPIKEWAKVQFRVEGFNILNHPNFQSPSGAYTGSFTGGFGSITSANNMREEQASLRITF